MDGHLVTVEVGVVGRTDERVDADGFAFDEHGLERLNGEAVERRRAVEQHRVALRDFLKDVPHFGGLFLDHLAGTADGVHEAELLQAADDERLEEDERHLLRQTALAELELRTDDDDGTAGVVDAFAEQVLTEAALLALEHVGERLQGAVASAGHRAAMTAVVEERVDCFLEHALFVVDDDVGRLQLHQVPQTVVAVDDAAVEIVEIGGGEAAAFERDERAQVRRDDGEDFEDHPLGTGVGLDEALEHLEALGELLLDLLRAGGAHLLLELEHGGTHVDLEEDVADGLGAHLGDEGIVTVLVEGLAVLDVGEELLELERGLARIDDEIVLVVDHAFEGAGGHVEQEAEAARHALQEPDVGNRHGQLNVAHAFAADARDGDFDAAAIADDVLVLNAFVLAASALVVAHRAEDLLAEETAWLGLEGAVVDGLRVLDLALGPFADGIGRGDRDGNAVERILFQADGGASLFAGDGATGFVGLDAHA